MISSNRFRRLIGAAAVGLAIGCAPALAAQPPQTALPQLNRSPLGNYLAARHAVANRDEAAASAYYLAALRADPNNPELIERTFLALSSEGNIDEAAKLAARGIRKDHKGPLSHLVLGVHALKLKHFRTARTNLREAIHGPITDLAPTLLLAWSQAGSDNTARAIETIDKLKGPDWYNLFKDLHAGLILDLAGKHSEAGKRFEAAYKLDPTMLRTVQAYGSWASRYDKPLALKIYQDFDKALPRHPLILDALERIKNGRSIPQIVGSAVEGGAEVLYGIGSSFGRRGGEDLGLIYLQLALDLRPQHGMAILSLADLYETLKKPDLALAVYAHLPKNSPLYRSAEIQRAIDLDALDRTDEAKSALKELVAADPTDRDAIMALGNIMRSRKQFSECGDVYSKAIDQIKKPEKSDWTVYYFRGICYERSNHWDKAEADLKKALELYPDQPHVLNYLGYSWIDKGQHLDEAMKMIRRAVEQRPDDGYIVDSLGWAYYRLGNYTEAVKNLEKAVEIRPEDPTINDHLGDAYWKIGRTLEAKFQWAHARDLKPEPAELATVEQKLKTGLVDEKSSPVNAGNVKPMSDKGG